MSDKHSSTGQVFTMIGDPLTLGHTPHTSEDSIVSDLPSPVFSSRPLSRILSVASSLPGSPATSVAECADPFQSVKRPLTEVKEETEKDDDAEMLDVESLCASASDHTPCLEQSSDPPMDWIWDDTEVLQSVEGEYCPEAATRSAKNYRTNQPSGLQSLSSKMTSRMPSLSRKWKSRRGSPNVSIPPLSREPSLSRAPSFSTIHQEASRSFSAIYPPTPAASTSHDSCRDITPSATGSLYRGSLCASVAESEELDLDHANPTTPLLPPLMTERSEMHELRNQYQSPLQSPSVAGCNAASVISTPLATPVTGSLPSPPLSACPSIASFRHRPQARNTSTPVHHDLVPSADIPHLAISEPLLPELPDIPAPPSQQDEWSALLGQADFTVEPAPYLPPVDAPPDASMCEAIRSDWNTARSNFLRHLAATAETYGPASSTYRLTKQKWTQIDAQWRANLEACLRFYIATIPDAELPSLEPAAPIVEAGVTMMKSMGTPPPIPPRALSRSNSRSAVPSPVMSRTSSTRASPFSDTREDASTVTESASSLMTRSASCRASPNAAYRALNRDSQRKAHHSLIATPSRPLFSQQIRSVTNPAKTSSVPSQASSSCTSPTKPSALRHQTRDFAFSYTSPTSSEQKSRSEIPCLNAHDSQGKFPLQADEKIVGHMLREPSYVLIKPSRLSRNQTPIAIPAPAPLDESLVHPAFRTDEEASRASIQVMLQPIKDAHGFPSSGPLVTRLDEFEESAQEERSGSSHWAKAAASPRKRRLTAGVPSSGRVSAASHYDAGPDVTVAGMSPGRRRKRKLTGVLKGWFGGVIA